MKTRSYKWIVSWVTILCCFALFAAALYAQSGLSSVSGTVVDAQGNGLPGATVKLTSTGQNAQRSTTTGDDGGYSFAAVMPGTYTLVIEANGFKRATVTDVRALV